MDHLDIKRLSGTRRLVTPAKGVTTDGTAMSARAVFATDSLDRVGDVLHVPGIVTANHQRNPVVLFDHGKWFGWPVGKTMDPAGNYTVELGEHEATQTTFFSQSLLEGEQLYRLVEEGVISANSIGYRPLKAKRMPAQQGQLQRPGLFLAETELLEVSWVGVPANGDCIRAALSRSQVCGKSLSPFIRRALTPLVVKPRTIVRGGFEMSKSAKTAAAKTKADPTDPTAPDATPAPDAAAPETDAPKLPLGAEILTRTHEHLVALVEYAQSEAQALENDAVGQLLDELAADTFERLQAIEALFASEYPDLDPLPEAEAPEGATGAKEDDKKPDDKKPADEGEKDDEEEKPQGGEGKSYPGKVKRLTKAAGNTIRECAEHLTEMSGAENLTKDQRVACKYYGKALGELAAEPEPGKGDGAGPGADADEGMTPAEKTLALQKLKRLELLVAHKKRLQKQKSKRR